MPRLKHEDKEDYPKKIDTQFLKTILFKADGGILNENSI